MSLKNEKVIVLTALLLNPPMTRSQLYKQVWKQISDTYLPQELDAVLATFKEAGMADQNSRDEWFMPPSVRADYRRRFTRKPSM